MLKYKNKYVVRTQKDSKGRKLNKDDTYIVCNGGGQIYRKQGDILVFFSPIKIQLIKRDKDTGEIVKDYNALILSVWDTDAEREITFKEENLEQLEELFKIRKRKQMLEENKEKARLRLQEMHRSKNQ